MVNKKSRLVTRSDFDGVVCITLLQELGMIKLLYLQNLNKLKPVISKKQKQHR